MKNFRWWPVAGMVAAVVALSGCGGGGSDSSSNASLRVANATLTHASLDLLVNGTSASTATATDTVGNYATPGSGSVTLQLNDNRGATALSTTVPTLTGGNHYTMVAYESGGAVKTAILNEDNPTPATGTAQLRVYNAALDAGKIDVYITAPTVDLATVSTPTVTFATTTANASSALLTYSPGTYRVRITKAGDKSDLRADIPSVVVTSQQIATVILTPAAGGALINGSTLIQQGAYAPARNTNARVRLAAAVSGGATVAASASSGAVIDAGSVAPAFGYGYVLVPATSTLSVTVNGAAVTAPTTALKAGADATLLVYGDPGAATATLFDDDNRLPSDATTTKLRLINGITGSTGTLTLTANTAPVGTGIAPGAASGYVSVIGSTNPMNLKLSSSTNSALLSDSTNVLGLNTVYTVLAGGPISAPQLLIR
ncbi:MAG TPA: DUF4397 domain-containing protein [Burkholderiaceae bacterium]|nr:DUF4397 domain-containing protein [Burkholderiaceae bacterium]